MKASTGPPAEDRTKWRNVPSDERIALARKLIVLHPRFRDAVGLLERCHHTFAQPGEPACGALLGASGVGKTSVVEHYFKLHPTEETETGTKRPVLKVTLQPDARPKGIAADILSALGKPSARTASLR